MSENIIAQLLARNAQQAAITAQDSATAKAGEAAASASAAAGSASAASGSAGAAAGSATAAATSATSAAGSATDAAAQVVLTTAAGAAQVQLCAQQVTLATNQVGLAATQATNAGLYAAMAQAIAANNLFANTTDPLTNGVLSITATANGSGGTNGTYTGTFTGGGGSGAQFQYVVSGGALVPSSIVLLSKGTGYTSTPTAVFTGAGFATAPTLSITIGPRTVAGDYLLVQGSGNTYATLYRNVAGTITNQNLAIASLAATDAVAAKVAPLGTGNVVFLSLPPESGLVMAMFDPVSKRGFFTARTDGAVFINDLRAPWSDNLWDLVPRKLPQESGVLWSVTGANGRASAACRAFGTEPDGSGTFVADIAIKPFHVSREFDLDLYRVRRQAWQVRPDGIRSVQAPIAQYTSRTGYGWKRLPRAFTRSIEGANGVGLQWRRTTGINIEGENYVGSWSPAAAGVASLRKIGTISNTGSYQPGGTWTPATGATVGDYYDVFFIGGGSLNVIGTWLMYPGDLLVWSGTAWVVQSAPHGGVTRLDGDWWDVTSAGTYNGIAFAVGDKIVTYGGPYYSRYLKMATGRYALRAEWSAASGAFPTAYLDQDVFQVTTAGTVGGLTFAVDDYLVRKSGAWARVPTTTINTTAINEWTALPVHVASDEWEMRRSDKGTSTFPVRMQGEVQQAVEPAVATTIYFYTDSMGRFLSTALNTALSAENLGLYVPGYVSAGAEEVVQLIEADIRQGIDPFGQIVSCWFGQNNETSAASILGSHLRAKELLGDRYAYYLPLSFLGRATVSWNGTRFVGLWQEPQKTGDSTNVLVQSKLDLQSHFPGRWLDTWGAVIAGVTSTLPHLQFPGMSEAQVASTYGQVPLSYYFDWASLGVDPTLASHKGTWSVTGLPTGGSPHDYYRRIVQTSSNEYVGNLVYNVAGVWTEIFTGSPNSVVHLQPSCKGNSDLAAAFVANLKAKKWIKS